MKISNIDNYDVLIIGAGPVGCVLAERFSSITNFKCLIVDKRNHIAGNCYDRINRKGLLYHKYGPHYLRFKNKNIYKYLSKFTKWMVLFLNILFSRSGNTGINLFNILKN